MVAHIAREHPMLEEIPKMTKKDLWRYVLTEIDFLVTPEQKRLPQSLSAAMHELARRDRRR